MMKPLNYIFEGYDFLSDPRLQTLFSYSKIHNKKEKEYFPPWSVESVLRYLESNEFKIKCDNDIWLTLKKDLFLIFIAAPKRLSEFMDFRLSGIKFNNDNSVTLRPHRDFISKNHSYDYCPENFKIIQFEENSELCPVNSLRHYIKITKQLCVKVNKIRVDNLWLNKNLDKASKDTVRSWIKTIILLGDQEASKKITNFHSIRGIAASILYKNFNLKTVMEKMDWKSSSTFLRYYYKSGVQIPSKGVIAGCKIRNT